jgi:DNA-binding response OmpR family regulator
VLVTGDNPSQTKFLAELLRRWDLDVEIQNDPAAAAERCAADPIDLVVLWLESGSSELMALLELLDPLTHGDQHLPVVVIADRPQQETTRQALALGARDVLRAPFDQEELRLRLKSILELQRRLHRTAASPQAHQQDEGQQVVLYVEDNDSNYLLVEAALAPLPNLRLVRAVTGEEALELCPQLQPDLILLDVHLPGVSGGGTLLRLRARPETKRTPVIVLSADATRSQTIRLLEVGADDYLTKPLDLARLLDIVQTRLDRRTAA